LTAEAIRAFQENNAKRVNVLFFKPLEDAGDPRNNLAGTFPRLYKITVGCRFGPPYQIWRISNLSKLLLVLRNSFFPTLVRLGLYIMGAKLDSKTGHGLGA
jgi:hypothetical protein